MLRSFKVSSVRVTISDEISNEMIINEQFEKSRVEMYKMYQNMTAMKDLNHHQMNDSRLRLLQNIDTLNEQVLAYAYRICFEILPSRLILNRRGRVEIAHCKTADC